VATTNRPAAPPIRPMTIQGRRIPYREVVRSLILPKNGLPTRASSAPTPSTSDRLAGACALPTNELTLRASVTSTGDNSISQVPM
jgi:hypothetical protein